MLAKLRLLLLGALLVLGGSWLASQIQTADGIRIEDVHFTGASGTDLAARLYIPPSATVGAPAPAVLISHGYINTREMQSPFAIELARRGFVVMAMDMAGHGASGGAVGADDAGGPAALKFLQGLAYVDKANIGLEGHSMGGVPIVAAAEAQPDGYRSMVLEGSTTPDFGQIGAGTPTFPRNLMVVFGQFDEFAPLMWGVDRGAAISGAPKLKALVGIPGPVAAGHLYGILAAGTGRDLVNPPITHPAEHFTASGVGAAVDWFQRTLSGEAVPKPPQDQIWMWKDIGTLISFVGFVCLLLGAFETLLATPVFAGLRCPPEPRFDRRGGRWWLSFALTAAVPALSYYPLMTLGFVFFPSRIFPQWVSNQLVVWTVGNAIFALILGLVLRGGKPAFALKVGRSLAIAALTVTCGYLALVVSSVVFKVDFRFWVLALRPLDGRHVLPFVAYLVPFAVSYAVLLRALLANLAVRGEGSVTSYLVAAGAMSSGFIVLLAVQYGGLFLTGVLVSPKEALNTIIGLQFVPLLAIVGLISAFTYRRTNSYLPGAAISALVITWYIVAGTATHWSPGWHLPQSAGLYPAKLASTAPHS